MNIIMFIYDWRLIQLQHIIGVNKIVYVLLYGETMTYTGPENTMFSKTYSLQFSIIIQNSTRFLSEKSEGVG